MLYLINTVIVGDIFSMVGDYIFLYRLKYVSELTNNTILIKKHMKSFDVESMIQCKKNRTNLSMLIEINLIKILSSDLICHNLTQLNVHGVDLSHCIFISSFSKLVNLKKFDCSHTNMAWIPSMKNLEELISFGNIIFIVESMPKLKYLSLQFCSIYKLSDFPSLECLDISHSDCLLKIREYPKLVSLHCEMSEIKSIPSLPELKKLICYGAELYELPLLPNLESLDCSDTFIQKLPPMPKLHYLKHYNVGLKREDILLEECIIETNIYDE